MSLAEELRFACEPVWSQTVDHPFMQGIRDESLPDEVMRSFLIQDHKFLEHFLVLAANALSLADSYASRLQLGLAIGGMAGAEDAFFRDAFESLGIDAATRHGTPENEATRRFGALMREAAATQSYAMALAVICEADWLFLDCATRPARVREGSLSAKWIAQFANEEVTAFVGFLREELDRVGKSDETRVRDVFIRANQLEKDFFDALY